MNISVEKTNRISSTKAVRKEQRIVTKLAKSRKLLSMYANDKKNVGCQGDFSWKQGRWEYSEAVIEVAYFFVPKTKQNCKKCLSL